MRDNGREIDNYNNDLSYIHQCVQEAFDKKDYNNLEKFLLKQIELAEVFNDTYYQLDYYNYAFLLSDNYNDKYKLAKIIVSIMKEKSFFQKYILQNIGDYFIDYDWQFAKEAYYRLLIKDSNSSSDITIDKEALYIKMMLHAFYNEENYEESLYYANKACELNPSEFNLTNLNLCIDKCKSLKNKICVYAMCKNEYQFIDKWLDSMSEADYIVVLDTGSTDGTYEKLKADKRVTRVEQKIFTPWRFEDARNESLKLVPKDANILMCTDLDELLTPGWAEVLKNKWDSSKHVRAFYKYVWKHNNSGEPENTFWYDKIHIKGYYWEYPVHERLVQPCWDNKYENSHGVWLDDDNIVLHHYPDSNKSRNSYLQLLELRCKENPDDFYGRLYLGREYGFIQNHKYREAIEILKETIEFDSIEKDDPLALNGCYCYIGDYYRALNEPEKAIEYYLKSINKDNTYRDPYLLIAEILNEKGNYNAAIGFVNDAFKNTYRHYNWLERSNIFREKPYDILAVAYYWIGNKELSKINAKKALEFNPTDERLQYNYNLVK